MRWLFRHSFPALPTPRSILFYIKKNKPPVAINDEAAAGQLLNVQLLMMLPVCLVFKKQDTNKTKTREELLAEERDYKRRRMSYRGKKAKRSTLQVDKQLVRFISCKMILIFPHCFCYLSIL